MKHSTLILVGLFIGLGILSNQAAAQGGTWVTKSPMPTPRSGPGVAVVNGILYAIGGNNGSGLVGTNEAYDPATDTWSTRKPMPIPRTPSVAVVNGIIYAIGGDCGCGAVESYNPLTDSWASLSAVPQSPAYMAVGVVNGIIYVAGGEGPGSVKLSTLQSYNQATDTWSTLTPMPQVIWSNAGGVVNGIFYSVGGSPNDGSTQVNSLYAYNPVTNSWSTEMPSPNIASFPGAVGLNGLLYEVGGFGGAYLNAGNAYDSVSNTWRAISPMPTARDLVGTGGVNGIVYAIGGFNGLVLGTNEALTTMTAQIQQPINPDGSSVFNASRGVVPIKFTLQVGDQATCNLQPATIALTRTAGNAAGSVDESSYIMAADTGSNFRISDCQYVYNLNSKALGPGTYRADIILGGGVVGSGVFGLK